MINAAYRLTARNQFQDFASMLDAAFGNGTHSDNSVIWKQAIVEMNSYEILFPSLTLSMESDQLSLTGSMKFRPIETEFPIEVRSDSSEVLFEKFRLAIASVINGTFGPQLVTPTKNSDEIW